MDCWGAYESGEVSKEEVRMAKFTRKDFYQILDEMLDAKLSPKATPAISPLEKLKVAAKRLRRPGLPKV